LKSVDELLHNKSLYKRSEETKEKMKNENGVEKATV
jgi:UDP:flavonoid glycosyltransferase YjiC (YdhE family)